jgi:hypothetical protein
MYERNTAEAPDWHRHLGVIGAEIFLAYRKCLMRSGISWTIWKAYPALSFADVMCRVHAGRQLLRSGEDFAALAAIRSGRWRDTVADKGRQLPPPGRSDCPSRAQVWFGGLVAFLLLLASLSAVADGNVAFFPAILCLLICIGLGVHAKRLRRSRKPGSRAPVDQTCKTLECSPQR